MEKYQLIENLPEGSQSKPLPWSAYKNRFFFGVNDELCYTLEDYLDIMKFKGLKQMDLFLAEREVGVPHFFCLAYGEVGEKGVCGSCCKFYKPRNKKSGACKNFGHTYSISERSFELRML